VITGAINEYREAVVTLSVRDAIGRDHEIDAIIDIGFSGSLTLPSNIIASWGLPYRTHAQVELGDGSMGETDVHAATVIWDGQSRGVLVESAETDPLIGMALLEGYELRIQVRDGGEVTIVPLT